MKIGRLFVAAIAVAALCGTGQSAKADSTTFLQFFQMSTASKPFKITYGAGGSIDSVPLSGVPVVINVDPVVGGPGFPIFGTLLDLHIAFGSGATFGGGAYSQVLGPGTIDISLGGGSILHVALTAALLDADSSTGHSPTVSATVPADGIVYSSTLFPLIGGFNHEQNFSLSFSALSGTPTGLGGGGTFLTGGSGVMSGSGTFAGAPVPEPGTLTLAFCAIPALGLISLRRRRAQA
jgi:hypothetical protein